MIKGKDLSHITVSHFSVTSLGCICGQINGYSWVLSYVCALNSIFSSFLTHCRVFPNARVSQLSPWGHFSCNLTWWVRFFWFNVKFMHMRYLVLCRTISLAEQRDSIIDVQWNQELLQLFISILVNVLARLLLLFAAHSWKAITVHYIVYAYICNPII